MKIEPAIVDAAMMLCVRSKSLVSINPEVPVKVHIALRILCDKIARLPGLDNVSVLFISIVRLTNAYLLEGCNFMVSSLDYNKLLILLRDFNCLKYIYIHIQRYLL